MSKSSSQKVSDYRRKRKKALVMIAGNKCNICNYNKAISALQFHHINPEDKKYGLAQKGTCHNLDDDLIQLKKCILVCANCHREIHQGFYLKEQLQKYRIFDEIIAQEILEDNHKKRFRKKKYCINCGKQLSYDTKGQYCCNCIGITRRKVERPDRETLKQLIRIKPFTQIGKDYQVTDNAVRKWCDTYQLPRVKKEINSYSDKEWQKV